MEKQVIELIEKAGGITKFMGYFTTVHHDEGDGFILPVENFVDNMPADDIRREVVEEIRRDYFTFSAQMLIKYSRYFTPQVAAATIAKHADELIPSEILDGVALRIANTTSN